MHLILFFTRGVALGTWAQIGSLEREIALYLRLQQQKGIKVSFVTYGSAADSELKKDLHGIEILCNKWDLPLPEYERRLPWLYWNTFRRAGAIKTIQTNGADVALRVARIWRKPLIARCGYMWSDLASFSGRHQEAERAREIENQVFPNVRYLVVTTSAMKKYVVEQYEIPDERVRVIPNYVLTDIFSPDGSQSVPNRICFIGRFSEEKNLSSLIRACAGLDVELLLIGEGHLRAPLYELASSLNVNVSMPGNIKHRQLAEHIRSSALFALVSPHEGHPKALLEAMSCGTAVLGADSPGIRQQIVHGETGWLCGTDVDSIREGIQHLLANPVLREELGRNARRFVVENYSLDKIAEIEYTLLHDAVYGART